jgi:hypothetical protein
MKQYRITSSNFVLPGETGDPDAYMDPDDLARLKEMAGIGSGVPKAPAPSTEDVNISNTGTEKAELMRKHNIKPGTPEWFQLWFSRPYLTGEPPVNK